MPGLTEEKEALEASRGFTVESQTVELEIDFQTRLVKGRAEIRIQPHAKENRTIGFHCRECKPTSVKVEGKGPQSWKHNDPYRYLKPHATATVHQHHQLKSKVDAQLQNYPENDLTITLPKSVQIRESDQFAGSILPRGVDEAEGSADVGENSSGAGRFLPLTVEIFFELVNTKNSLQWVGCDGEDSRWPHVYTKTSPYPGPASCLFPCIDDPRSRHPWSISLKFPKTLGDAFRKRSTSIPSAGNGVQTIPRQSSALETSETRISGVKDIDNILGLDDLEAGLELAAICSGELSDEAVDNSNSPWKTSSFVVSSSVSANQIGFAIGPFEDLDLSDFREIDEDERLGQQAVRVHGFCLPGRTAEVRNTCMPLAKAIDFFTTTFTTYTGESWKLCFVDDLPSDTIPTASFSICSNRLLFPEDILDPLYEVTRKLVHALASQYAGIDVVPSTPKDSWVIAGISWFMADIFMRSLCGNNEYRYQQKLAADRIFELDINRPSIYDLGETLRLDPSEAEFMELKAGAVLFILDRRLTKSSGSAGITRIIGRIFNNAKADEFESSFLSTAQFQRLSVKMGHLDLDSFFNQWVFGAGCPIFEVRQSFNKKKLCVQMTINQMQGERPKTRDELDPETFLRDTKEDVNEVFAGSLQPVFTGPMTIRIHEADGTPYEHIVDINKAHMSVDIPYNNKYKRKKSRKQKERQAAAVGAKANADGGEEQDDVLLYSLGDILQSSEEMTEWRLNEWDKDMEEKMSEESFEWVRMDADFEWICKISIHMPAYMWVSQLQQDRDVVAQMESLVWVKSEVQKVVHPIVATFLIRTLLDRRYFHGIRTIAASMLACCAKPEVEWVGLYQLEKAFQELFCVEGSSMPRPNDFSDRTSYLVQCAILRALADVKGFGRVPAGVKRLFLEKLKFNDNSSNEFSDCYYISTLLQCLTKSLIGPRIEGVDENDEAEIEAYELESKALIEIDRYRRIDEWTCSYRNTLTTTALACLTQLAKEKIIEPKLAELLQYTRPENSDDVRLRAFDCLVELDALRSRPVLRYVLHELSHDRSQYVRDGIFRIFGKGLGKMAIHDEPVLKEEPVSDGLVIEQESASVADAKEADVARKQTTEGALAALKAELGEDDAFKKAIWFAVKSPLITLDEISRLLDICAFLFEPHTSLLLELKMPRYWRVRHDGAGQLTFTRTDKVRWTPLAPLELKEKPPTIPPMQRRESSPGVPLKLVRGSSPSLKRKQSVSETTASAPAVKRIALNPPSLKQKESSGELNSTSAAKKALTTEKPHTGATAPTKYLSLKPISLKRKESSSEMSTGGPVKKARSTSDNSPSTSPAPAAEGRKSTIVKLRIGSKLLETQGNRNQSQKPEPSKAPANGVSIRGGHMGYGPVNSTPSAPLGYGKILASPTTEQPPSSAIHTKYEPSVPTKSTSPPPRHRTFSTAASPTDAAVDISQRRRSSRASSASKPAQIGSEISSTMLNGSAIEDTPDEVAHVPPWSGPDTSTSMAPPPQPEPAARPKLKIRLGSLSGSFRGGDGAGSPATPSGQSGS